MKNLAILLLASVTSNPVQAQDRSIINNSNSPHMPIKSVDFGDVTWTEGFWGNKTQQYIEVMLPNLGRLMHDPEIIHAFDNFLVAAGLKEGEFRGWSFTDGDYYKYVEALAVAYEISRSPALDRQMNEIIDVIAKAQQPDGYIHTKKQIGHGISGFRHKSWNHHFDEVSEPFTQGGDHEFYNFGHLFTAACVHHRVTGETNFLEVAKKSADLLYEKFHVLPENFAKTDWNPPHLMGLVEMYRTTGERKYLELAKTMLDARGTGPKPKATGKGWNHSQNRRPIREETQAIGHAGHANYLYAGIVDLYAETGDETLLAAAERIWEDVVFKKMYVHGGTGQHHYGTADNTELVSEAYGDSYQLPNIDTYNETCANIGNAMWNWRLFLTSGDARYMDVTELAFYNSSLGGISQNGTLFSYTNPLRYLHGHPHVTKDDGGRSEFMSVFCCPPNIVRTIGQMDQYAYATSDNTVWFNMYGGSKLSTVLADGSSVMLTQKTDFPWDGKITISIDACNNKPFALKLRIPGWAPGASASVNGNSLATTLEASSYYEITRKWSAGDTVELNLPMDAQLLETHPFVEQTKDQVAVRRGPLIYCLEGIDLPENITVSDVIIPTDIMFTPHFDEDLFSGITVLEGEALARAPSDWSNALYRPVQNEVLQKVRIRMIPYYTWANRGKTDMSVWLPAHREATGQR